MIFADWFRVNEAALRDAYREDPDGCSSFSEFVRKWWKELVC